MSRFLGAYCDFVSKASDAPIEFAHAAGLAAISTVALGRRWIERGRGGIRPNVYIMLVAGSSRDRKSENVDHVTELLRDVVPDRVGATDFTAEGLVRSMQAKQDGTARNKILIPWSEFGSYLSQAQSYGATIAPTLCTLYDGADYERQRAQGGTIYIEKPRVSILAAVAYGMMEKYADPKDWATGFYARFMFVSSLHAQKRPRFEVTPPFPRYEWDICRMRLRDLAMELQASEANGAMEIEPEGLEIYKQFVAEFPEVANDDLCEVAQRERLMNAVWKVAMLYQIDINPHAPICAQAVHYACMFGQQAWHSFKDVYRATAGSDLSRLSMRVWRYVHERTSFKDGHVSSGVRRNTILKNFSLSAEKLNPVFDILFKNGALETVEQLTGHTGAAARRSILVAREAPPE